MDNAVPAEESRSRRGRLMGKLFGAKDRKEPDFMSAANVDAFLHSTSADTLEVVHPPPPPPPAMLPKLDTTISRYPQALAVNQTAQLNRPVVQGRTPETPSPRTSRPNRKGQVVKFSDLRPEIMGEGGDECPYPVMEISRAKQAKKGAASQSQTQKQGYPLPQSAQKTSPSDEFQPKPLARTQTGFSSINTVDSDGSGQQQDVSPLSPQSISLMPARSDIAQLAMPNASRDDKRRSYIEIQSAQMRQAEGRAFAKAVRTSSVAYESNWEDGAPPILPPISPDPTTQNNRTRQASPEAQARRTGFNYSPAGSIRSTTSSVYPRIQSPEHMPSREGSRLGRTDAGGPPTAQMASVRLHDTIAAAGDDALVIFVSRTTHLFELFQLHAETIKPISSCSFTDVARAGLWWFLKGRLELESAVRERPSTPKSQMKNDMDKQQAYTNLAKAYWLCAEMVPEIAQARNNLPPNPEVDAVRQGVISALSKLSMSMKRNGFLPPEEFVLPQTVDKFIWLEYPAVSQDLLVLLSGNWGSGMSALQQPMNALQLMDAFPLGDSVDNFSYGRISADAYLMEQGRDSERLTFPCLLSMVRPQRDMGLIFVIASQDGSIQLAIQDSRGNGPSWNDMRWRNETCCLELRLPRGFILAIQVGQNDYRMLWNMYDFGSKVRQTLQPRNDEVIVFQSTVRSFQYMDADPQSRIFPREAVPFCDVALFEKVYKQTGPAGPRIFHAGFRVAAVTGPRSRTLSGVHHNYPPEVPIQFGFFRGEGDSPALSLRFDNGRQRGRMVFVFSDDKERIRFHSLITGTALEADERIFANVPLRSYMISKSIREPPGLTPFSRLPWTAARVVNDEFGPSGEQPSTVLADKLKIVLEFQNGTITDRLNAAPGELRIRLDVGAPRTLRLMRPPQHDITLAYLESSSTKEQPIHMSEALQLLKANQTIRTLEFASTQDLHDFQFAITGFEVVFDAVAVTFAIARRRMVVPIHKKWEAGSTRIQIVKHVDKQIQLLAFFEDFHHGHCMNFLLKGTDIYESFTKSGKAGFKIVDAKFPLPHLPEEKDGFMDDMAFVCLDLPDLPGEHDDISILFETETDRDKLCSILPAAVKGSSRITSRLK